MLTSEHKRKIKQRVETYPFKNPPPGGGKAKGSASLTRKLQQDGSGLLSPDLIFPSACSRRLKDIDCIVSSMSPEGDGGDEVGISQLRVRRRRDATTSVA